MKCSIVIPAYNEADRLERTIKEIRLSARVFDQVGWDYELIVCDNNSSDDTAEVARACGAITVFEPVNQIARARNCGARTARGEWLLFIDADTWPSEALFGVMQGIMESGKSIGGGALVRIDSNRFMSRVLEQIWKGISLTTGWAAGSFLFCRHDVFKEVLGFNEALYASEEIDLSIKLKKWAKQHGNSFNIIRHHPVLTSGRKLGLYRPGEMFRFLMMWLVSPRKAMTRKESCFIWYDGRR